MVSDMNENKIFTGFIIGNKVHHHLNVEIIYAQHGK